MIDIMMDENQCQQYKTDLTEKKTNWYDTLSMKLK